jgi:hypothetical protein
MQPIDALHSYDLVSFLTALVKALYASSANQDWGSIIRTFWLLLPDYVVVVMMRLFLFSIVLSVLLVFVIIWISKRIFEYEAKIKSIFPENNIKALSVNQEAPAMITNEKWLKVVTHINSENPSDWKLAILECDIMLGDILEKMGYLQDSIGEKLKAVEPSDFTNIENAWEAHKIRNMIAHEGSDFAMNEREAKRVIGLYETVFREFAYI